jgi:REP element-mobilizing transposase RayT
MVIAAHFTFSCYGFWPPNDDRGSWSDEVWAEHLKPFGDVKPVSTRRSIAHVPHDRNKNRAIRNALLYPPVKLDASQRELAAKAFAETVEMLRLITYACTIMPDHVHFVAAKHPRSFEEVSGYLKRAATRAFTRAGQHPLQRFTGPRGSAPTPWAHGGWMRFIFHERDIPGAVDYVRKNPLRIGEPVQEYLFTVPCSALCATDRPGGRC